MDSSSSWGSSGPSLRPYRNPDSDAAFKVPAPAPAASSSSSVGGNSRGPSSSSGPSALRVPPPSNRYAMYEDFDGTNAAAAGGAGVPSPGAVLKAFATSSILAYVSTGIVMPFEVGKTLAQVQYIPKSGIDTTIPEWDGPDEEEEAAELEGEEEAEAYFSDLTSRPPAPRFDLAALRPPSPSGYLPLGSAGATDGTKPEWILPVVVQDGVWDMMKSVWRWNGEGLSSLWKGQLTTCVYDALSSTLQPVFLSIFALGLPISMQGYGPSLPLIHAPAPTPLLVLATMSHTVTAVLLSPLDLVRTRLIVQSAQPRHRKYKGPLDALETVIKEEGGLYNTYFHPSLIIPTLLDGVIRPLLHLSAPLIISRLWHIDPLVSPITYGLAELFLSSAALFITIPLETVRKRLQIQTRAEFVRVGRINGTGRPWRTCVETRAAPYVGVVDAVYRILTEETGRLPRVRRRRSSAAQGSRPETVDEKADENLGVGGSSSGILQLYRGLQMGLTANAVVFLLGLVQSSAGGREGWAEM